MSFEEFQDGRHGYWNETILAFLNLCVTVMLPIKFWLNPTYSLGDIVWRISWRPSWISNRTILAILNLYVAPMPPIKFQLNLTYGLGGDVVWRISRWPPCRPSRISERKNFNNSESLCRSDAAHKVLDNLTYGLGGDIVWRISRWPPWQPSWISERNNFSNSKCLCHCDASHQVWAQSNLQFGRRCRLKNMKMAGHLEYQNGTILTILNLYVAPMPPMKFRLNLTYGLGGDVVWRISRWQPSWISERNDFSNSESLCHFDAQSDLQFGKRRRLKNFKMQPSWISERNNFSNSESLCHCDASRQVSAQSDLGFRKCRL